MVGSWLDYVAGSGSRVEWLEEGIELVAPARGEYAGGPKGGPMDMRGCAATPRRPSGHLQKQNGYRDSRNW